MTSIITLNNINKSFNKTHVLKDVSFKIEPGLVYGFLGPNGAGKTTTMKLIMNLIEKTSGQLTIKPDLKIIYLQDVPEFYDYYSIEEYLRFICALDNIKDINLVNKTIEDLGLTDIKTRKIKQLSRGQRQRLGIAASIITKPDVLILDEPVSALDPQGRYDIFNLIDQLKGEMTIIFSTHILDDIARVCDHIILINKGQIILDKSLDKLGLNQNKLVIKPYSNQDLNQLLNILKDYDCILNKDMVQVDLKTMDHQIQIMKIISENNIMVQEFALKKDNIEDLFLKEVNQHD